ncbi:basic 7S globulin 2-like [Hordeum vulgare]|nr:basic 7S globulin 2-like [Hordeum vulgare]
MQARDMSQRRRGAAAALLALVVLLGSTSPPNAAAQPSSWSPLVARVNKDASTSLYTIAIKDGGVPLLLLDLAGPMIWIANCPCRHRAIECGSNDCLGISNMFAPDICAGAEWPVQVQGRCICTAMPYNPVDGRCIAAQATTISVAANATDGRNPLFPVSFPVVGSCAPGELLASLPAGVAGVAGLARLPNSLPLQVANWFRLKQEFALCLPRGGDGVAIFGGGPFQLLAAPTVEELADNLRKNPLPFLFNPKNRAYYFTITGIAVNQQRVPTPSGAFGMDWRGQGGAAFSTVTSYTALRWDIYWPLRNAFDAATSGIARADKVAPFDMCYQASELTMTRVGYAVASIDLMLDGGQNWTLPGASSLVQVNDQTVCFAFVQTAESSAPAHAESPAVIFGGHQLEDNLLLFDLDKDTFAFSGLLLGIGTTCSNFDFSMGSS